MAAISLPIRALPRTTQMLWRSIHSRSTPRFLTRLGCTNLPSVTARTLSTRPSLFAPAQSTPSPSPSPPPTLADFTLADQVILVTGGARGLGLTQAEALLESGATVYALDRLATPSPNFSTIQNRFPNQLHYRQTDVRDVPGLNDVVRTIADTEGRIDGLIAAAGIQQETPALEYTAEDANRMFEINVTGAMMSAQAVARQIIRLDDNNNKDNKSPSASGSSPTSKNRKPKPTPGGSILLVASMSGTVANRALLCAAYNASKAGVVQLTRNLAAEWGVPHSIRVNSLSPGYIVTEMTEELFQRYPERREQWARENMLGRLSGPRDFRGVSVFLMSGASGFVTGADFRVDGGHCAW